MKRKPTNLQEMRAFVDIALVFITEDLGDGWDYKDVCRVTGIKSPKTIENLFTKKTREPRLSTIQNLAHGAGLSLEMQGRKLHRFKVAG